jgi:preprotein translocase subunit SecB
MADKNMSDEEKTNEGALSDTENVSGGNGAGADDKQFLLQQLYIKDLSFEAPNTPDVFNEQKLDTDTQMNIKSSHRQVGDENYEVALHLSIHAKNGEQSVFLVELEQAGIFLVKGYSEDDTKGLLATYCPATLFPYAREAISSVVGRGGFPPLMLQPINFDALYAQAAESKQTA